MTKGSGEGDQGVRTTQRYAPTCAVPVRAVASDTSVLRGWIRSSASRAPRSARSRPSCAAPRPQWSDTRGPCYVTAAYSASNSAASTSCAGLSSTSIAPPSGSSWSWRATRTTDRTNEHTTLPVRRCSQPPASAWSACGTGTSRGRGSRLSCGTVSKYWLIDTRFVVPPLRITERGTGGEDQGGGDVEGTGGEDQGGVGGRA